jgi:hypothetical protein
VFFRFILHGFAPCKGGDAVRDGIALAETDATLTEFQIYFTTFVRFLCSLLASTFITVEYETEIDIP